MECIERTRTLWKFVSGTWRDDWREIFSHKGRHHPSGLRSRCSGGWHLHLTWRGHTRGSRFTIYQEWVQTFVRVTFCPWFTRKILKLLTANQRHRQKGAFVALFSLFAPLQTAATTSSTQVSVSFNLNVSSIWCHSWKGCFLLTYRRLSWLMQPVHSKKK